MIDVQVPELGEGIEQATVACWHAKAGERVSADDDLVELVTDKATFNVPAPATGRLERILAAEGENVKIGVPIASLKPDD